MEHGDTWGLGTGGRYVARKKIAYIGGGSTRAPGTMASLIAQGENFAGSEIVLIDLDKDRLALVKTLADKMVRCRDLDLTISTTTDRRAGLSDCDAVLTSYRPGGFAARVEDERIPLKYGMIGQETQGPGGFFMALRSIQVMKEIVADLEQCRPERDHHQLHEPGEYRRPGGNDKFVDLIRFTLRRSAHLP